MRPPKGTFDILPFELPGVDEWKWIERWHLLEETIHKTAKDYGFSEVRTPIFEQQELFVRSVGDTSDIVSKEMYTFKDKGKRDLVLRPEGTAPVARAYVTSQLNQAPTPQKLYYIGPFFRQDRPQAGRYRQFHQFGAEAIGISTPELDVELIDFLYTLYQRLSIENTTVMINSVGNKESRDTYKEALVNYLTPLKEKLSEDSQVRLEKNPLRILDSKAAIDQTLLENAPSILDFLDESAYAHFERVKTLLTSMNIPFIVNDKLVRGLDYYEHTVFEVTTSVLGAQNAIGAGGRYDHLIGELGGPSSPAIGFATGMERILQTMIGQGYTFEEKKGPFVYFVPLGDKAFDTAFSLARSLRHNGISTELYWKGKKLKHALQTAVSLMASYVVVIGDDELAKGEVEIKELATRKTWTLPLTSLLTTFKELLCANDRTT